MQQHIQPQPALVAEPYVRVATSPNDWRAGPFIGSPTLARLPSGELLFCHDLFSGGCGDDTSYFHLSTDNGQSWMPLGELPGMFWPSLFICASGLYVIGVEPGQGRARSELCIARSDDNGRTWSAPTPITSGLAVHRGNTGVPVSNGRVTASVEVAPQSCRPRPQTSITESLRVKDADLDTRAIDVHVADPTVFAPHSLVSIEHGEQRLHARVLGAHASRKTLTLRPERWTAVEKCPQSPGNSAAPWDFPIGSELCIASGTLGNNRDFWVMAADADETADLCDPQAWRLSNPVANPAYTHARALHDLFGLNFVPRDDRGVPNTEMRAAWSGWLEGVPVRLQHPDGDGSIVNLMRVATGGTANIGARIRIDDRTDTLTASFDRYTPDPGLGCTHAAVQYDPETQLYWMASNVNRDSTRDLTGVALTGGGATQERSNLALFYSRNCIDWFMSGLVAYSRDWVHSFHYPYFIIDGDDLLFAVRSHIDSPLTEKTIHTAGGKTADNHNSNAATFHRVPNFRHLANLDFIRYQIPESE